MIGLPVSSVSSSAIRSTFCSIRSATLSRTAARSLPEMRLQRPSSNASRAAAMAASVSAAPPSAESTDDDAMRRRHAVECPPVRAALPSPSIRWRPVNGCGRKVPCWMPE